MINKQTHNDAEKQLEQLYNETVSKPFIGNPTSTKDLIAYLHKKVIMNWRIIFSHNIVQENDGKKCKIYILTTQLYPEGRGSTKEDWTFIGWVTGYIERHINQDNNSDVHYNLITPIETTHPNDIYKWYWMIKL